MKLPSIYNEREHNPVPERFKKHIGKPAMSYSSYNSFIEESYKGDWIANKFLKEPNKGNIFTEFGSSVGNYQETRQIQPYLSEFDIKTLDKENPANPLAQYEREIVIDRGSYVIYGFVDRILGEKVIDVADFKSGGIDKKRADYESEKYNQTTLYCYGLEQEGFIINSSGVILFDRKGNTLEEGNKNVLRLTGEVAYIPTPYSKERAEKFLLEVDEVAKEIEDYYKTYLKYFK